jgi:hypothetical protein
MKGQERVLNPGQSLHAFYGWELRRKRTEAGFTLADLAAALT